MMHRMRLAMTGAAVVLATGLAVAVPQALAQTSAPGAPGANATWNEPSVTGFADSLGASSKVWYTIGDGELENAFYPETDMPATFGLQYAVTDGSTFTELETTGTSHVTKLLSDNSLVWQQVNTADNGDYTITKTYIADPSRSVIDVQTTFDNTSGSALKLYVDYHPQLDNDGMGNTGGTDSASGDLEAVNGSVASALTASAGFSQTTSGYAGTSSDGETMLTSSHSLTSTYSSASTAGHIDQVAQIPVAASGSTTFTLALAFDTTEAAAISDASASLTAGFSSLETSFESGWQSWLSGLSAAPASVTGTTQLKNQYYVSLMELKADEDKTYTGAFIAAPTVPWGASVSADSGAGQAGAHGYHAVWTRDEYEMATTLLAAGDKTDAQAALNYIFGYEMESSGAVKQNTWLNGNAVFGSIQMDEVADPIILAYQLGDTSAWSDVEELANYLVANGPYTLEERWEENAGYSPATMAAEIAGLICAAYIANANNDAAAALQYQETAQAWASEVDDLTYTTTGSYGNGDYLLRITPDGQPNAGTGISIANGGGSHDDRTVVDPSFLELVRLGVKSPTATDITNTISVVDSELETSTPEGPIWHRYSFDGYGETTSGGDFTGSGGGVGNPWPVLSGERGEYDVADANPTGAQSMLSTMAGAANSGYQISEQVWGGSTGVNGFTFGQADNSSTPLMWAMAQYVRLAIDISAGKDVDTPAVVSNCLLSSSCPVAGTVKESVNVTVPVNTDASQDTVYLDGNLSALGYGQADWSSNGIAMTRVSSDEWTATVYAKANATLSYKYDLGGNWSNSEETADCGSVSNRSMSVSGGTENDTVANWEGPGACGNSGAVINVSVPSGTPSGDTVYLSGNYNVLGTGIGSYDNWLAMDYPMIKTGADTWTLTITGVPVADFQYKFTLGTWGTVEETSSCGSVSNRSFNFNDSDASYTANDTVAAWDGVGSC
ncbi:MAG TPA: glycoside hydrolase family 15 protein [Streptosporangiaceae bacterium]